MNNHNLFLANRVSFKSLAKKPYPNSPPNFLNHSENLLRIKKVPFFSKVEALNQTWWFGLKEIKQSIVSPEYFFYEGLTLETSAQ